MEDLIPFYEELLFLLEKYELDFEGGGGQIDILQSFSFKKLDKIKNTTLRSYLIGLVDEGRYPDEELG
jgi:hypothetical protein